MSNLGLPVPPGFTITTEVCTYYYDHEPHLSGRAEEPGRGGARLRRPPHRAAPSAIAENPLLVSVRSGARASMPGMMDTVLNLGLNDETVEALAKGAGDERFAYDSYRRFITMYSNVVLGIEHHHFEEALDDYKERKGLHARHRPHGRRLEDADRPLQGDRREGARQALPAGSARAALGRDRRRVRLVDERRAIKYRELHAIPASWGTAVNVQAMVFGNMGETSATGVAFTRNPSTGENELYGEFLINAQGEDVVAGIRTPQDITEKARASRQAPTSPRWKRAMPEAYRELVRIYGILEKHYRDMQDMEFTVENGKLWMLQTRNGKRTAKAALRIAVDLAERGPDHAGGGGRPRRSGGPRPAPASDDRPEAPSARSSRPACRPRRAPPRARSCSPPTTRRRRRRPGARSSSCASRPRPEDIHGMHAAEGILTTRGGMTSHAAVVARGMGKPCVSGAGSIRVDYAAQTMTVAGETLKKGDVITIDGSTGQVLLGAGGDARSRSSRASSRR